MVLATALVLLGGVPANAQFVAFDDKLWGAQFSYTPTWQSVGLGADALRLQTFDLSGSDYAIGFARGRMRSGHWGLSFLRQRWKDAAACTDSECFQARDSAWLQGFSANWFVPFGSPFAADRVQAGMNVDLGGAWLQGSVRVDDRTPAGTPSPRAGMTVPVTELLPEGWGGIPIPLFRAEAAVAVTVVHGLKVIGTGGYGFPFKRRFGISVAYFPLAGD